MVRRSIEITVIPAHAGIRADEQIIYSGFPFSREWRRCAAIPSEEVYPD